MCGSPRSTVTIQKPESHQRGSKNEGLGEHFDSSFQAKKGGREVEDTLNETILDSGQLQMFICRLTKTCAIRLAGKRSKGSVWGDFFLFYNFFADKYFSKGSGAVCHFFPISSQTQFTVRTHFSISCICLMELLCPNKSK